jgi:hypothetical protein
MRARKGGGAGGGGERLGEKGRGGDAGEGGRVGGKRLGEEKIVVLAVTRFNTSRPTQPFTSSPPHLLLRLLPTRRRLSCVSVRIVHARVILLQGRQPELQPRNPAPRRR